MTAETAGAVSAVPEIVLIKDGSVATISLNRPKAMNALNHSLMRSLSSALDSLEADPAIRAVVITGSQKVFAAGADIKEMENSSVAEMTLDDYLSHWDRVARFPKPVIAAVGGAALGGGCELALACDLIVAGERARFSEIFARRGLSLGFGGSWLLPRLVGTGHALDLLWMSDRIDARTARDLGLVEKLCADEDVLEAACEYLGSVRILGDSSLFSVSPPPHGRGSSRGWAFGDPMVRRSMAVP